MRPYTIQPNNSKTLAPSSVASTRHAAVYLNGKIYKFGGLTGGVPSAFSEVYDIASNTWSSIAALPIALAASSVCAYNDKIYIFSGQNSTTNPTGDPVNCFSYDPATNAYTSLANSPMGAHQAVFWLDSTTGVFYMMGGYASGTGGSLNTGYCVYNIATNTWSAVISLANPTINGMTTNLTAPTGTSVLANTASAYYNGRVYIFGVNTNNCYSFNTGTGFRFEGRIKLLGTALNGTLSTPCEYGSAVTVGNFIYLHFGSSGETVRFDPATAVFESINKVAFNRRGHFLVSDGTSFYVMGGNNMTNTLSSTACEKYTPDTKAKLNIVGSNVSIGTNNDFSSMNFTSWNTANPTSTNSRWIVGNTGLSGTSGHSAFITTNGTSRGYLNTTAAWAHLYRDITVPTGFNSVALKFFYRVDGEALFDYLSVRIASTPASNPIAGSEYLSGTEVLRVAFGNGIAKVDVSNLQGQTIRLCFSWRNDSSGFQPANPGATIDTVEFETRNY